MTDFGRRAAVAAANVLPKTGQLISYRSGDDGYYEAGWEGDRFTDNGNGTITDNATGLIWAGDADGDGGNSGNKLIWNDAIDWAEALDFAGSTDWRLANALESITILQYAPPWPFFYPLFQGLGVKTLWTSTSHPLLTSEAMTVDFINCSIVSRIKSNTYNVLATRGA